MTCKLSPDLPFISTVDTSDIGSIEAMVKSVRPCWGKFGLMLPDIDNPTNYLKNYIVIAIRNSNGIRWVRPGANHLRDVLSFLLYYSGVEDDRLRVTGCYRVMVRFNPNSRRYVERYLVTLDNVDNSIVMFWIVHDLAPSKSLMRVFKRLGARDIESVFGW